MTRTSRDDMYDPTPPTTWLGRARYTPARDALRGELSARLDPRTLIAAADLPAPLSALVYTVVRRSRLWRREKLDVARELLAHFSDGLAAGRAAEQLIADFGPIDQAARLIRRGKIRNRPRLWLAARFILRTLLSTTAVFLVVYGLMMARFYFSVPAISRNYWIETNEARATAPGDAAWPLYRDALISLGRYDKQANPGINTDWIEEGPTGKHWPDLVALVERRQDAIRLIRDGAKKPRLGYLIGAPEDQRYFRDHGADWLVSETAPSADENLPLLSALLTGPQELREFTRLLSADAAVAVTANKRDRVVEDLTAMLAIGEQFWEPRSSLVEQLISLAIFGVSLNELGRILSDHPDCLTDDQLRKLAHRIAAYRDGDIQIDYTSERDLFDDLLQRAYTDDGAGDGHLTAAGLNLLSNIARVRPTDTIENSTWFYGPMMSALVAGRAESRELAHRFYDQMIAAHQGPPWLWDATRLAASENLLKEATEGHVRVRYMFPSLLLPGIAQATSSAERAIQARDAAEVVIALVLFKRRHGAWPQRLDDLVPDLLPAIPPDRFDGQPLRYTVRDGRPLLYSLGNDRDDDGGRPTKDPNQAIPGPYGPIKYPKSGLDYDGDWILWPPLPPEPQPPWAEPAPDPEQ